MPTNCLKYTVIVILVIYLFCPVDCLKNRPKTKFKRNVDNFSAVPRNYNLLQRKNSSYTNQEKSRGFFAPGLLTLGKVLNFFPVGGERECQPSGYTAARAGICVNQYDCRQRDGRAAGQCARGLGVCCVFEVTCGGVVQNNLTYFMSPGFPELWSGHKECGVTIEKTHAGVTQLRIDFVHFTIGQPNRTTGECDEDVMTLGGGDDTFTLCGQNHGQHIYYTLPSGSEVREAGDLPSTKSTRLNIRMSGSDMPRLWLVRLAQLPLAHAAPHDCRQYYTGNNGTIRTFNFASNGRHLAGQEYRACIRRNTGFCAVRYTTCDQRSFRIGSGDGGQVMTLSALELGPGGSGGPGTGFYGPDGQYIGPSVSSTPRPNLTEDLVSEETQNGSLQDEQMMPAGDLEQMMPAGDLMQDEDGSGDFADGSAPMGEPVAPPSFASRIWSFIWPSWLWEQRGRSWGWSRWSPYAQHYAAEDDKIRYYGYGNFGFGLKGFGRQQCTDRITIPCENEYFVSSTSYIPGVCDPHHCGSSFCPGDSSQYCRVETSITPFAVTMHFGPPTLKRNPEDNIGACLKYTQLPCDS